MSELENAKVQEDDDDDDDGVMVIREIGMVPMSSGLLPPPPVLEMMEMMNDIAEHNAHQNVKNDTEGDLDYIEEKTTKDGKHIHKEVHESHGVKTI